MRFEHLKTFHRVALTGSFTKAARSLNLSQPAVSQHIQLLEHSLGIVLLDRQGRKIRPTKEGEVLLYCTDRLFNLYEEIKNLLEAQNSLKHGRIAVGSSNVMGTYYLPQIIKLYNDQYPGINIDLRLGNSAYVLQKVLEGVVDIGIAGKIGDFPRLTEHFVHRERLLVVSSPQHKFPTNKKIGVDELLEMSFISREQGTLARIVVERWFKKHCAKSYPIRSIELENTEAAKKIVQQGYGFTIIPECTVKRELENGLLTEIDVHTMDLHIDLYVYYLKGKVFSKAVQRFLNTLSESQQFSSTSDLMDRISDNQ